MQVFRFALPVVLAGLLCSVQLRSDPPPTRCFQTRASMSVSYVLENCDSVVGFCTEGQVRGFSILRGTSAFVASGIGGAAMGEESIVTPPAEPGTTWSYSGQLTLNTIFGQVFLRDIGVFDTVNGSYVEQGRIEGGTGLFKEATGTLFFYGYANEMGTGFDGDIRGQVCVPRRRH